MQGCQARGRPGTFPKRRQEERGWCGKQGSSRAAAPVQSEASRGLTRAPWEGCPCQTCHLAGCGSSSSSSECVCPQLCPRGGRHPGRRHFVLQMLCPSSSPLCHPLLSLARARSCSASALPSLCQVTLNQKPAPQCVHKRCPNTHF